MKTLARVVLPLLALVGIVFGIAYVTQYTGKSREPDKPDAPPDNKSGGELRFREYQATWDPDDPEAVRDVEIGTNNHYDFWFYNPCDRNVVLGVREKSCTCASVALGTIPDAGWAQWAQTRGLCGFLANTGDALLGPLAALTLQQSVQWDDLTVGDASKRDVPPPSLPGKPGILRINWEAKQREEPVVRLFVEIYQQLGEASVIRRFEARYAVVPVLAFAPPQIDVGDIPPGGKKEVECYALSTTREEFDLSMTVGPVSAEANHPCFQMSKPIALTKEERETVPALLGTTFDKMRVRGGYKFVLTIHESREGRQLDFGPLSRRLDVTVVGFGKAASVPVAGLVKGDVEVHGGSDADGRIRLGTFNAASAQFASVRLATSRRDFDLKVDYVTDRAIKHKLTPEPDMDGKKWWKLEIEIEPFGMSGPIPGSTVLVISTKGPNSRLLRIPISGNATR